MIAFGTPKEVSQFAAPTSEPPSTALFAGMDLNDPLLASPSAQRPVSLIADVDLTVSSILDSVCSDVMYKSRHDFSTYTAATLTANIGEVGRSVEAIRYGSVAVPGAGEVVVF